jgi:hypothetical protein
MTHCRSNNRISWPEFARMRSDRQRLFWSVFPRPWDATRCQSANYLQQNRPRSHTCCNLMGFGITRLELRDGYRDSDRGPVVPRAAPCLPGGTSRKRKRAERENNQRNNAGITRAEGPARDLRRAFPLRSPHLPCASLNTLMLRHLTPSQTYPLARRKVTFRLPRRTSHSRYFRVILTLDVADQRRPGARSALMRKRE